MGAETLGMIGFSRLSSCERSLSMNISREGVMYELFRGLFWNDVISENRNGSCTFLLPKKYHESIIAIKDFRLFIDCFYIC